MRDQVGDIKLGVRVYWFENNQVKWGLPALILDQGQTVKLADGREVKTEQLSTRMNDAFERLRERIRTNVNDLQ